MSTKRGLLADVRRAFDALAYADLGEYLPQEEKEAILGATGLAPPAPLSSASSHRPHLHIALAVQGQVQPSALRYARNACERLDADLDILTDLVEGALSPAIEPERRSLANAGHAIEIVRLGRDILRGIVHYARDRSGLLFVVVSAEDRIAERVIGGRSFSRGLDVPWVVVAPADAA